MSDYIDRSEYDDGSYELGDRVWFKAPWGDWVRGEVVRVYNTRTYYHVEYGDDRYGVEPHEMSRTEPDEYQ